MQKLRKGLSFMLYRRLAVGFASWKECHDTASAMGKGIRYFMNRELARGWVCWHTMYDEQKRKLESMRRSMNHMLNRELSRGFGAPLGMLGATIGRYLTFVST